MKYTKTFLMAVPWMAAPYLAVFLAQADSPKAVMGSFEDFIKEVVVTEDQKQFRSFYKDLIDQQKKDKQSTKAKVREKQQKYAQQLRQLGANSLEVKDSKLSENVKPYLVQIPGKTNQEMNQRAQAFLLRYGAYEEYLQQRATKRNSILAKTGSYFKGVGSKVSGLGSKVSGWFNGLRRSKSA